jgi:hypothetical protein
VPLASQSRILKKVYKFTTVYGQILSDISEICHILVRYNEGLLYCLQLLHFKKIEKLLHLYPQHLGKKVEFSEARSV